MALSKNAKRFSALGGILAILFLSLLIYATYEGSQNIIYFGDNDTQLRVSLNRSYWKWVVLPKGVTSYKVIAGGEYYEESRWMKLIGESQGQATITLEKERRNEVIEGKAIFERLEDRETYSFPQNVNRIKITLKPNQDIWVKIPANVGCVVTSVVGYDRLDETAFRGDGDLDVIVIR